MLDLLFLFLVACFMSLQACAFFAKSTVSKLKSEAMLIGGGVPKSER